MTQATIEKLLAEGIKELERGNSRPALALLQEAYETESSPSVCSYLALCLAREKKEFGKAVSLCREALGEESSNSLHYLNLGRIYLLSGDKNRAIRVFRDGLLREENRSIIDELKKIGWRKPPVFPSLPRGHFLNRYLGKLLSRCGLR